MRQIFSHYTLQSLYESAKKVLDEGGCPELLRAAIQELEEMARFRDSPRGQEVLHRAAKLYAPSDDRDVAVDYGTILYHNETDGYWVMGWCYVEDEQSDDMVELGTALAPTIVQ